MPIQTPRFVSPLLMAATDEDRAARLKRTHDQHKRHGHSWELLLDAFEGTGGFADGTYLWPYPRESETEYKHRCAMARYHNYVETLVDLYVRFMFTSGVKRTSRSAEFNAWQADVDGAGTGINEFMKRLASVALVSGHAGGLVDKTSDEPLGPTKAEDLGRVVASVFTAPTILDWRYRNNRLHQVKLCEAAPEPGLADEVVAESHTQYLLWDDEGWARFSAAGQLVSAGTPNLGLVPLVVLRPKPRQTGPMVGRALVSNANVVRALFNRASEEDEVIRAQAFSVLTVSVPPEGNVEDTRTAIGSVIGTAKALVVKGDIDYKTPDQSVPGAIRDNIAYLVQEMFRAAHVRFKRDSLAAESGESIRLQYTELNEMLQGFSKSLAQAEHEIARAWFAWTAPSPEAALQQFEAAKYAAEYPTEFFLDDLMTDLEAWAEALRMNLGPTMAKRIKKRAARRIEPEMPPDELDRVDRDIDQQDDQTLAGIPPNLAAAPDLGEADPDMVQ